MLRVLPEAKTYLPGPGRCIYCWPKTNPSGRLGREHIIAHKLGGKLILHKASCKACEALINSEIETPALGQMWISARTHLGLPTSRPKTTLRIGVWTDNGEAMPKSFSGLGFHFEEISLGKRTFVVLLPTLLPPGILHNRALTENFTLTGFNPYIGGPLILPHEPGERAAIFEPFRPEVLGRFIAKVAHSAAIAELGLDTFEPLLPDIIKGVSPHISHFVGSSLRRGRVQHALHRISLEARSGFLIASVQLFAKCGLLPYEAVVGRLSGELSKLHSSSSSTA
jgi:hypothetical protein